MKVSMISLLRNLPACLLDRLAHKAGIYQKLLEENKAGSPFRDYIWVEQSIGDDPTVPLGTEYEGPFRITNHIAYLRTGQAGLRHVNYCYPPIFYRYAVPKGALF
jgi:hypothetical protein